MTVGRMSDMEFTNWLISAKAGDHIVYGTAVTANDTQANGIGYATARAAYKAYRDGLVHLTQRATGERDKTGCQRFDYIATRATDR